MRNLSKSKLFLFFFVILSQLVLFGCKDKKTKSKDNTNQVKVSKKEKINVSYYIYEPDVSYNDENEIDTLVISFNGSVAKVDDVGKAPSAPITLTPSIAGEWKWSDDSRLVFYPSENWMLGQKYKISMPSSIFSEFVNVKGDDSFITDEFSAYLSDEEFYIDPEKPTNKRVTCTIYATHPLEKEHLEDYVTMTLSLEGENRTSTKQPYNFTISYNKSGTRAYLISEIIPVPPKTSTFTISLKKGVKADKIEGKTTNDSNAEVTIPGMSDFVRITDTDFMLVKNEEQNYDQVITIETKGKLSADELSSKLVIYELPKDRPEMEGWSYQSDASWSTTYCTDAILASSKKVNFTVIPTEENASSLNSVKLEDVTPGRYLYVYIKENLNFYGGYKLSSPYETTLRIDYYPKELGILSEGSILSLSGSKKMAMYSRGVQKVNYTLYRVMPKDVNHLISMSNGNMKNFDWSSYYFNEKNISEKEVSSYIIPNYSDKFISYFSFDFTNHLKADNEHHLTNGLFIFDVADQYSSKHDKRFILITDIGFFVKRNNDYSKDIFVQSISSGKPIPNAAVSVIGLNGNTVASTSTDANGHATLPSIDTTDEHRPIAYVIKYGNDLSFMPYSETGRSLDYSNFDIGGEYTSVDPSKITAYMFSDRGMYRPGDTVNIGVIAKAGDWNINLKGTPFECEVLDANGSIIYNKQFQLSSAGFEEINFSTHDYSPTGNYTVNLYFLKPYYNSTKREFMTSVTVKIEEFLPDTLKLSTSFDPLPNNGWINPGQLTGVATLKNLYGTPAAGNEVKAQLTLEPGFPVLRKYADYYFTDPYYKGNQYDEFLGSKVTDENGIAKFELNTEKFEKATYRLQFYVEGYEKGSGRSVSQQSSVYISPLKYLIGYKADGKLSYVNKDSDRKLSFIAINQDLEKIDLDNITLQLEEIRYVSTLVKQSNGLYKYQSVRKNYPIKSETISISKNGTDYFVPSKTPGEYKISLINSDGLVFNTINFTIVGTENITRSLTRTAELELSLEKSDLKAGDTAKVFIKAPYKGAGLITVEREKVYTWKWFKADELSSVQTIQIPKELEGNGYINVMFTRDINSDEIFMSPFCYGAIPFDLDKESKTNKIKLDFPDEVKSGTDLNITYSTSDPGKIVIYAVDEGILQVANYSMPNPLSRFFKKRALQVRTSQILDLVLPEYEILRTLSAMGGGAGMDELSKNLNPFKRKQNAPVAYWSGIIDAGPEKRTVTYHVPDYFNGNLKVMAVAVSQNTIGTTQSSTLARNTFIISPNVPLAAAPGDEFDVSVTVTNNHKGSGDKAKVTLKVEPSNNLEILGNSTIDYTLGEGKDVTSTIRVKAKNILGNAELKFTAKDNTDYSVLSSTLSVRPSMPYQIWINSGVSKKGKLDVDVNHKLYDEFAKREVSVANIPTSFLDGLDFYLANYPYGCAEQITSKAYPYVYEDFVKAGGKTHADAENMISETISIIQSRMKSSGHVGYWTSKSPDDPYITLYVAEFLTDAKLHNFYVPSNLLERVLSTVENIASSSSSSSYDIYLRSYAIYILTKNEIVTTSYLESLENDLNKKNYTETDYEGLYLAASYAMLKQDKKANEILAHIKRQKTFDSSWNYHNSLHYIATYIDVIARYFPSRIKDIKSEQIDLLCNNLTYNNYSTMSTAAAIRAFESYAYQDKSEAYKVFEINSSKAETEIPVKGEPVLKGSFSKNAQKIKFTSSKEMPLYYQTLQAGFETDIPTQVIKDGLEVTREYLSPDGSKLSKFTVGDDVLVKISFRSTKGETLRNIALIDLQPAGLEGDIESIRNFNNSKWMPDYVDIREDRVVIYGTVTDKVNTFTYTAKAINSGKYIVPPMFAESMYNKEIRAIAPQNPITIEKNK